MLPQGRFSVIKGRFRRFKLFSIAAFCLILLSGTPLFAQSTNITQATISEIVGSQVLIRTQQARIRDIARTGEQVRTTQARTQLTFNTGAVGRLGPNSALTVGQQCFQMQRGEILVSGAVNGCTSTVRAGVRGTTYYMDINQEGDTHVRVLEGEVELTNVNERQVKPVRLIQGQGIVIERNGQFQPVRQMPRQTYDEILTGPLVEGFGSQLPTLEQLERAYESVFPGADFPIRTRGNQQGWNMRLQMARLTDSTVENSGIRLQLEVLDKPITSYANAVYQLYARKGQEWVQVSNQGARLLPNGAGAVTLPSEDIPMSRLWLGRLGENVRLSDLELQGVVLLRYDLPGQERDLRLQVENTEFYSRLPLAL